MIKIFSLIRTKIKKMETKKRAISIIVARDKKNGIGKNNQLIWNFSSDLKWFKEITTKNNKFNNVIMGRKTWDSIPSRYKPLSNRKNIVISRTISSNNAIFVKSFSEAINCCNNNLIFIIGGQSVYDMALNYSNIDDIYVTDIDKTYNCDTFFNYNNLILKNNIKEIIENNIKLSFNIYKLKGQY